MSLHQKGRDGEKRQPAEAQLFKQALSNMMVWYSHPKVLTLKLTTLPEGYPSGLAFPADVQPNVAGYFERGWERARGSSPRYSGLCTLADALARVEVLSRSKAARY